MLFGYGPHFKAAIDALRVAAESLESFLQFEMPELMREPQIGESQFYLLNGLKQQPHLFREDIPSATPTK